MFFGVVVTLNQLVAGSIPARLTIFCFNNKELRFPYRSSYFFGESLAKEN